MALNKLERINLLSRIGLAFLFFYHGLFPKILWLSPLETHLVELHGIDASIFPLSQVAGFAEIAIAVSILVFRKSLLTVYAAALALILLLIDVAIVMPGLLVEAFNPVSTNMMGLLLCYFIWFTQYHFPSN